MARASGVTRPVVLVVTLAVVVGGGLRAPLAHAWLPYLHDPDEDRTPRVASAMVAERRVDPGFYSYPGLLYDLSALVLVPFVDRTTPTGVDTSPLAATQTQGNAVTQRPRVVAALRWTVGVLPGLVAVVAAGTLAWLASRRWWLAGMAAGLMALSPLDLMFGRYMTPNALAGATSGLVMLAAVWLQVGCLATERRLSPASFAARGVPPPRISPASPSSSLLASDEADSPITQRPLRDTPPGKPQLDRYLVAGAAVGLAAAAKYNAVLLGVAVVVAHVTSADWGEWRPALRSVVRRSWLLLASAVACLAVFLTLNPGALVDWPAFRFGLEYERDHYQAGHSGNEGSALTFHLRSLWDGFGPAVLLAPLSLLARDRSMRRAALVLSSGLVVYLGFVSSFEVRFARNLLPVTMGLAVAIALGSGTLIDRGQQLWASRRPAATPISEGAESTASEPRRRRGWIASAAAVAGCLALLVWPGVRAGDTVAEALPDPWLPAQRWIGSHVEEGDAIAVESYGVYVDPGRYRVGRTRSLIEHDADWYRDRDFVLLVASERNYLRYLDDPRRYPEEAAAYEALLDETCRVFSAGPTDERVVLLDPTCSRP